MTGTDPRPPNQTFRAGRSPGVPETAPVLPPVARVLAAIAGVAAAGALLLFGGLYALFSTCEPGGEPVCGSLGGLVDVLELVAVFGGATAALAGGVGTAASGRARWLVGGLATTVALAGLLAFLVGVQAPTVT